MKSKKSRRKSKTSTRSKSLSRQKASLANECLDAALSLHRSGDIASAELNYRRVLEVDPNNARSLHHLGLIAHQRGDVETAVSWIRRAVLADSKDAASWNNLGNMCRELGRYPEAIRAYRTAIKLRPDYENAHYNLGLTVQKLGDARAAVDAFREVLKLTPGDADTWNKLGSAQLDDGEPAAAKASHERALELAPRSADAYNGLGLASMDDGDFEAAANYYRLAIELDPGFTKVYLNLAKSRRFSASDKSDLDLIESVLSRPALTKDEKVDLHFALGKALDDCALYDSAFSHFREANTLRKAALQTDHAGFETWIDAIISTFDDDFFKARSNYGSDSDRPVFIIGMPRSGTTLVEQIIASHPLAHGAGELPKIGELNADLCEQTNAAGYPAYLPAVQDDVIRRAASDYLGFLDSRSSTAKRVTDKLPGNYIYLGLIALMFPRAHVIDCRREPLDVVLSVYFSQFVGDHPFAYDLDDIVFEYEHYLRLMEHWTQALPVSLHRANYEDLINSPEQQSKAIIAACGLDWDERCLRFYENKRPVHTASNWQVRQPIYSRAVGRWKNYEQYLAGVTRKLA